MDDLVRGSSWNPSMESHSGGNGFRVSPEAMIDIEGSE